MGEGWLPRKGDIWPHIVRLWLLGVINGLLIFRPNRRQYWGDDR